MASFYRLSTSVKFHFMLLLREIINNIGPSNKSLQKRLHVKIRNDLLKTTVYNTVDPDIIM